MELTTLDNVDSKTKILRERAKCYGVNVNRPLIVDAASKTAMDRNLGQSKFNMVFVDTPCSGLGTLRRHPELK